DVCRMAAQIGYDGIEFRGEPPVEMEGLSFREYCEEIAAAKKKYSLSEILFGIAVRGYTSDDKATREKAISDVVEKVKIANDICGTTLCNTFGEDIQSKIQTAPAGAYEFTGSAAAEQRDWDMAVEAFDKIGRGLEKLGVRFAFETHMIFLHDLPRASKKLVDLIDSPVIGINMDYGNTVYFPEYPSVEETIDIYGDKIFYTHLKNSVSIPGSGNKRLPTALSDGEINHRIYLKKLREVGFDGPIGIEAPRPGDRTHFAKQDFDYFKAVMKSL
ncbi:MAG: sugar phosphate isomerase/epimerase, partial [Oscillospiraceae bacterium]|nr:sugar phosphate isomerase/epimerase [Oscillospiraceae bacterium]